MDKHSKNKKKKIRQKRSLPDLLVETAAKLLQKKNFSELSLREIARHAGVTEAAPYRHFEDKESLLAELCKKGFEILGTLLQEAVDQHKNPEDQYHAAAEAYLSMGLNHPEYLKLMFGPAVTPGEKHLELFECGKKTFSILVGIILEAQKKGVVGDGNAFHRALHTWASIHGFTLLVIDNRCDWLGLSRSNALKAVRSFSRDLLEGMRKPLMKGAHSFKLEMTPLAAETLGRILGRSDGRANSQ